MTQESGKNTIGIWQVTTAVLAVLLVLSLYWGMSKPAQVVYSNNDNILPGSDQAQQGAGQATMATLTSQQAADKALKYVNDQLLQGSATATVKTVSESGQFYALKLSISGQDIDTYVTKDGKLFFPQAFDMDTEIAAAQPPAQATEIPKTENPEVHLYTMSYCPYGNQAEEVVLPVVQLLGSKVEIQPHYVIYANYGGGGPNYCIDNESKYCSMHGIQELHEDVRELCIYKYQKDKYWDFVSKVNTACSSQNVDTCWEAVATQSGIDTEEIKTCQADEAIDLLKNEVALNTKYGVRGSPDLVINGVSYNGARTPDAFKQGICSAFTTPPSECSQALDGGASAATGSC